MREIFSSIVKMIEYPSVYMRFSSKRFNFPNTLWFISNVYSY